MARIRTIKPEFFTSEDIVSLTPLARLLYIALWCEADKEGRMAWKPVTFKMRYLPADGVDIKEVCQELLSAGLVVLYGQGLAYIPSFKVHQHINPRETASRLPDPDENDASGTRAPRVSDETVTHREEGKGKERNTREVHASPSGVSDEVWQSFLKVRKAKKAPMSDLALAGIKREADAAGWTLEDALSECVTRGWQAFKADWVAGKGQQPPGQLGGFV